jgi:multidrug resistance efflux pump
VLRRAAITLLPVVVVTAGCSLRGRPSDSVPELRSAVVRDGPFEIAVPVTGELDAEGGTQVISKYGSENTSWAGKIKWVAEDGKPIEKGALVMELAGPETEQVIQRLELELESAMEETREAQTSNQRQVENARAALRKAEEGLALAKAEGEAGVKKDEASLTFAQGELDYAKGELAKRERLARAKLTPLSQVEEARDEVAAKQFEVEKAKAAQEANQAKRELQLAACLLEIDKAKVDLANAKLHLRLSIEKAREKEDSIRRELEEEREVLTEARIFAPESGILMLEQTWDQGLRPRRPGDTVWHYSRVGRVVSFDDMIVRCEFGELDMARVKKGQQARVRILALPGLTLPGKVESVENVAIEGNPWEGAPAGRRVCRAIVKILDSDPRLRPGMSAMVETIVGRVRGLHVPIECVFHASSQAVVYRLEGQRYRAVSVDAGERSDLVVAVKGDLKPGDRVACQRPPQQLIVGAGEEKG